MSLNSISKVKHTAVQLLILFVIHFLKVKGVVYNTSQKCLFLCFALEVVSILTLLCQLVLSKLKFVQVDLKCSLVLI